jgi:hypothetical protein
LRDALCDYLRSNFDVYLAPLTLSSTWLRGALEGYLADERTREGEGKDVQISLGFDAEVTGGGGVKGMDVTLGRADVEGFFQHGREMVGKGREGKDGPFWTATRAYMKAKMALDIERKEVRVTRVGCGGFVIGGEGKVKIFAPAGEGEGHSEGMTPVTRFVEAVVRRAEGGKIRREIGTAS